MNMQSLNKPDSPHATRFHRKMITLCLFFGLVIIPLVVSNIAAALAEIILK